MNEKVKNFLQKSWNEPRLFFFWLGLFTALFFIVSLMFAQSNFDYGRPLSPFIAWPAFVALVVFVLSFPAFVLSWIPPARRGLAWLLRRRWLAFAVLVTLIALLEAVENFRGKRAWENCKRESAAQGEKLEISDIAPPLVPDDQNFAAAPVFKGLLHEFDPEWRRAQVGPNGGYTNTEDGFKLTLAQKWKGLPEDALGSWSKARRTDFKKLQEYYRTPPDSVPDGKSSNDFPVSPQPQSPPTDVLFALSKYDVVIAELRAAESRPYSRFPVRYEDAYSILLPHMANSKGCVQVLAMRASAELTLGESDKAIADVKLGCRVTDMIKDEPLLISQLVYISQTQIMLQPIWEGLADHRWSDSQLAQLQAELGKRDFLAGFFLGMRGERAMSISTMNLLRRLRDLSIMSPASEVGSDEAVLLQDSVESASGKIIGQIIPGGWFEQNKVSLARMHRDYILPAVDQKNKIVSPAKGRELEESMIREIKGVTPYNWFGAMLMPALNKAAERCARAQTCVDLARIACALERHRLAHGSFPESLDSLAPQFIDRLPHDVINGQSLKYRRTADGQFVLYSVGWNEKDDGGKLAFKKEGAQDWEKGDWVWHYSPTNNSVALE